MINQKTKKMKTISINKLKNSNVPKNNISNNNNKSNKNINNLKTKQNIQKGRNMNKNSIISYNYNKKPLNSINLLQTYLKNCPNYKKISKSKPLLKEKTKTIYHSTEQLKTFSVRKNDKKKKNYSDKILGFINSIKNKYNNNYNTSNNLSINDKKLNLSKKIIQKKLINKSKSNISIIKRNGDLFYPKKSSIKNKKEFKLNVNLNLHSIFINHSLFAFFRLIPLYPLYIIEDNFYIIY